jgi:protein SCO1/2
MGNLKNLIDEMPETPGKDFNIATVSFNPGDNPKIAARKEDQFWGKLDRQIPASAWRFLTGDSTSICELTNSMGFYFTGDKYGMFTHPTALIFVDKDGKIVRYIQGTTFTLVNVEMALREAKSGAAVQIIDSTPQVCFSHNPSGLVLADNLLRISGVGTLIILAGFMVFIRKKKKFGKSQRRIS